MHLNDGCGVTIQMTRRALALPNVNMMRAVGLGLRQGGGGKILDAEVELGTG